MSLKIAIASGKGGTGKTTVAVNLFHRLALSKKIQVQLVDCDVEAPNASLFFHDAVRTESNTINQQIPAIDFERCTFCKKCVSYCEFNAISIITGKYAAIDPQQCHSCGACLHACSANAIAEHPYPIGQLEHFQLSSNSRLVMGTLNIGSAMQTMVIRRTKEASDNFEGITLFDAPPGTSCPVVQTLADCDYVVLVTEPTSFGFHDLKLMIELVNQMELPFGVVINKAGIGNREVEDYLNAHDDHLLGKIPFLHHYAANYSKGNLLDHIPPAIEHSFEQISNQLNQELSIHFK